MRLPSLHAAIEALGCGNALWLRGHVAQHCLIPALFRFPGGLEHERRFSSRTPAADPFDMLLRLHHSYVPTRLLAWTRSLHVALFCALVREHGRPAIFVLDPVALNAMSAIEGVVRVSVVGVGSLALASRARPIAVEATSAAVHGGDRFFTVHGTDDQPLEEQCPNCVRKVILTDSEVEIAQRYVLSNADIRDFRVEGRV